MCRRRVQERYIFGLPNMCLHINDRACMLVRRRRRLQKLRAPANTLQKLTSAAALKLAASTSGASGRARARATSHQAAHEDAPALRVCGVFRDVQVSSRQEPRTLRLLAAPVRRKCCAASASGSELAQT